MTSNRVWLSFVLLVGLSAFAFWSALIGNYQEAIGASVVGNLVGLIMIFEKLSDKKTLGKNHVS